MGWGGLAVGQARCRYNSGVSRFVALLLLCLVPLQLAWAGALSLVGHPPGEASAPGWHVHDEGARAHVGHDEQPGEAAEPGDPLPGTDGHCHASLPFVIAVSLPLPVVARASAPAADAMRDFASRTPPLFDRPPATRG